jgi:SPP1 gp7 family putative phage head morphogenesis protein
MDKKQARQYQQLNEQLQKENQSYANNQMQEAYKEKKKQQDKLLNYIIRLYATYKLSDVGGLILQQGEKRKVKFELKDILTTIGAKTGKSEERIITNTLKETAKNSYYKTNFIMDVGLSFDLRIGGLSEKQIKKVIYKQLEDKSFSTRIWNNQTKLINELNKQILDVVNNGKDVRKATKIIKDRFGVSAYNAKRLVENEVKNTQTRIQDDIYKKSDVVKKVMWTATLDEKTRDKHREFDGKSWSTEEPHPTPEQFCMCRCTLVPVIDAYKPTKRYVQQTGETIKYVNYKEWAKAKNI